VVKSYPLSTSRTHFIIIIFLSLSCNYMKTTDIINDVEDIMHNKAFLPVRILSPSDENLYCLRVAELFQLYSKWVRFHKGFI